MTKKKSKFANGLIEFLEGCITSIDPGITFPKDRLNYKSCVKAILAQSERGRQKLYVMLVTMMKPEDKEYLLSLLAPKKPQANGDQHAKTVRRGTSNSSTIQGKVGRRNSPGSIKGM